MDDLESLLRASRPEAIVSPRHRQELDLLLRARMAPAVTERLSAGNYLAALAFSFLLLIAAVTLAPAPRFVAPALAGSQEWPSSASPKRSALPNRTDYISRKPIPLPLTAAYVRECLLDRRKAFGEAN